MKIDEFVKLLKDRPAPNAKQMENLEKIKKISKKFHREAGVDDTVCDVELDENTIVLESGHQPNFLPHAGLFKKVFLLEFFKNKLKETKKNPIALFGFADYNLSTAKLLYSNKIPAITKEGYVRIGFKVDSKDRWKSFDSIKKPNQSDWVKFIEQIKKHYGGYGENLNESIKKLQESYKSAKNFSDFNAFFFAKMCKLIGLNVIFFRYSDVHRNEIFLSESEELSRKTLQFNKIYNETIKNSKLNLKKNEEKEFPFWYHCDCGGKVKLFIYSQNPLKCKGICPICKKEYNLDLSSGMKPYYKKMGMSGVARNVIFSKGLCTAAFTSGSGGALRYGVISTEISKKFNFNVPFTFFWRSKDLYIGPVQYAALRDLSKILRIKQESLNSIAEKVENRRKELYSKLLQVKGENKKEFQKYNGLYISCGTQAAILAKIFGLTPSALDLFASINSQKLVPSWLESISDSEVLNNGEFYNFEKSIKYPPESTYLKYPVTPKLFKEIDELEGDYDVQ